MGASATGGWDMTSTVAARTAPSSWFSSWFDSVYYHKLYAHRDETEAARFIDTLIERLHPAADAEMLDLGCGAGRHSRRLASRGFRVTGLDLAVRSVVEANRSAGPRLAFRRHDMRQEFGSAAFDYILNLFTSFGYFETAVEHLAVVRNMATALKVGGTLVLDYLNARDAERKLVPEEVRLIDGVTYRVSRWTDGAAFYKQIVIDDPAWPGVLRHQEQVARFGVEDFERMFAPAGLRIEAMYGDYHLGTYDVETSPRLILVARRAARARQSSTRIAVAGRPSGTATLPHAS